MTQANDRQDFPERRCGIKGCGAPGADIQGGREHNPEETSAVRGADMILLAAECSKPGLNRASRLG